MEGKERRRGKRTEMPAELLIKRLDRQEEESILIRICDISTTGLGFICKEPLENGSVYECILTLWNKDKIHSFVEIVRREDYEMEYRYGAFFVGMTEMDAYRIEVFQMVQQYLNHEA